jgi:hypothetical protein
MKWINGNKTIIGQVAIIILMAFQTKIPADIFAAAMSVIIALTGASLVHHVQKQTKKK